MKRTFVYLAVLCAAIFSSCSSLSSSRNFQNLETVGKTFAYGSFHPADETKIEAVGICKAGTFWTLQTYAKLDKKGNFYFIDLEPGRYYLNSMDIDVAGPSGDRTLNFDKDDPKWTFEVKANEYCDIGHYQVAATRDLASDILTLGRGRVDVTINAEDGAAPDVVRELIKAAKGSKWEADLQQYYDSNFGNAAK